MSHTLLDGRQMKQLFFLAALVALPASAATFLVPTDEALVRASGAIIVATAGDSHGRWATGGWIETVTTLRVNEAIKGPISAGQMIEVTELGGGVGEIHYIVPGSPSYEPGQ